MRVGTFPWWKSVLLAVALAASASAWSDPTGYAINSRGYDLDSSRVAALWAIDLATGDAAYVGWTGRDYFIDVEGLAFDSEGRLYGADDSEDTLIRISSESGNAAPVGGSLRNMQIPGGAHMDFGLTFTCKGDLLVSSSGTQELYRADIDSGELTLIGRLGAPIVDMATIGDRVFGIGLGTDDQGNALAPNLYEIDVESPAAELIGPLGRGASPYIQAGLAADESGQLWAITDRNSIPPSTDRLPSEILRIDPTSGAATRVAETIVGIESLAITGPGDCDRGVADGQARPVPVLSIQALGILGLMMLAMAVGPLRRLAAS